MANYSEQIETTALGLESRKMVFDALNKLGCKWTIDENVNNMIKTNFQGNEFFIYAKDELPFIMMHYPCWERVELYDIDEVSRWRQAINDRNRQSGITAYYTINKAGGYMYINSKVPIILFPNICRLDDTIKGIFRVFFQNQRNITDEVHRLRIEEGD